MNNQSGNNNRFLTHSRHQGTDPHAPDTTVGSDKKRRLTQQELIGLMLEQNINSNRPAWDVRAPVVDDVDVNNVGSRK